MRAEQLGRSEQRWARSTKKMGKAYKENFQKSHFGKGNQRQNVFKG